MYTLTVKISAMGTVYQDTKSMVGHMWYSLSDGTSVPESYGFAPSDDEDASFFQGKVKKTDDKNYKSTYYTGKIIITSVQYKKLQAFGETENLDGSKFNFSSTYNLATNSCIDYLWKALNIIGINLSDFEGQASFPTHNADSADEALYKYLTGSTTGWDESRPDGGGYDVIYGSKGNDTLRSNSKTDAIYGGSGNDDIYGNKTDEKLYGGDGADFIDGDSGNDYIEGGKGEDDLLGDDGRDILIGGEGSDNLLGGRGDDILIGSTLKSLSDETADHLKGGSGYDTYIAGKDDTIHDSDGKGKIQFNGVDLTGVKTKVGKSEFYEDDDYIYQEIENTLQIIAKENGDTVTIENWSKVVQTTQKKKEAIGITLQNSPDIEASVLNDDQAFEAQEIMRFNVGLDRELISGEEVVVKLGYNQANYANIAVGNKIWRPPYNRPIVTTRRRDPYTGNWYTSTSGGSGGGYWYQPTKTVLTGYTFVSYGDITFSQGEQEKVFTYTWKDDSRVERNETHAFIPHIDKESSHYSDSISVTTGRSGTGTIIDDDFREPNRIDPLVLDTNQDGFISTTVLEESNTYFDITGDGLRERVGWVKPEDGLLVYDKNENGQIDGIGEVFGNLEQSGFDELKKTIDSNHDNVIDRKDELFSRLQVWNDLNQDAKVQEGEIQSLSDAGITNIDLNLVETNIEINGNLLTEASKYTTSEGAHELVADVQLATDTKDTKVDVADIPDFTVDEITFELPHLKGTGLVYDTFIKYNTDPEFKAMAVAYANTLSKLQVNPDAIIENWSGYTHYINELKERYSIDNFSMQESDKKAWIADRFYGTDNFTSTIEEYYNNSLNSANVNIKALVNEKMLMVNMTP